MELPRNYNGLYPEHEEILEWDGNKRKLYVWDNMGHEPTIKFVKNKVAGLWVTNDNEGYFHASEIKE